MEQNPLAFDHHLIEPIQPGHFNQAKFWRQLQQPWILFCIAVAVRLIAVHSLFAHTPPTWGKNELAVIGGGILSGKGLISPFHDYVGPSAWFAPVYPTLLAGIFWLFGSQTTASLWAAVYVNVIVSSFTAVLILKLAGEQFGELPAIMAAWAWGLSPPVVIMPWLPWETCLSAIAMVYAIHRTLGIRNARPQQWAIVGGLWGLSGLLNPALLAPLPVLSAVVGRRLRTVLGPVILLAVSVLAITPWTVRNVISLNRLIPVRSNFWPECYFGNVGFDLHPLGPSMLYQREGEVAFAADMRSRMMAYLDSHFAEFATHTAHRIVSFWAGPPQFGIYASLLALFTAAGLLRAWRTGREWQSFAVILAIYPLIYYITFTFARFRHPIEPLMYVLSGVALSDLASFARKLAGAPKGSSGKA